MICIVWKTGPVGWTGSTVTPSLSRVGFVSKTGFVWPEKRPKAVRTGNFKNSVHKFSYVSTIVSSVLIHQNSFFSFNEPWFSWIFFWENVVGFVNRFNTLITKINKKSFVSTKIKVLLEEKKLHENVRWKWRRTWTWMELIGRKKYSLLFNFEYSNTIRSRKNKNRSIIVYIYIHIQVILPYIL